VRGVLILLAALAVGLAANCALVPLLERFA
jgi:hypothetical protein